MSAMQMFQAAMEYSQAAQDDQLATARKSTAAQVEHHAAMQSIAATQVEHEAAMQNIRANHAIQAATIAEQHAFMIAKLELILARLTV